MNTPRNTHPAAFLSALSLLLLPATQGFGQTTATTDPVGYTALTLPASTDSLVSIPFTRPASFVGAIGTAPGTGSVITTAGTVGSTSAYKYVAGTQANHYYAIIGPNLATVSGTVSVTNGSTAVTATAGLSSIQVNDELIVNGLAYNVASVTNDTALVLSRAFTGTTASGQTATYDHSPKEGSYYPITDNSTNTVTVNLNGDSLNTVTAGTTVSVIPYWKLGGTDSTSGGAFPDSDAGTSYIVSGTTSRTFKTQLLIPDLVTAGVNLAAGATYVYNSGAWRLVTTSGVDTANSYDDVVLPPTNYFTVRNSTTGTTFTPTGGVVMNRLTTPLDAQAASGQDNAVAVPRPAAVTLNDLDLISSGAFTPSTAATSRGIKDTLLYYNNGVAGINKAADASYIYLNNGWRLITTNGVDTSTDYGNTATIAYGTGFVVRKAPVTGGVTSFWQNTRNY